MAGLGRIQGFGKGEGAMSPPPLFEVFFFFWGGGVLTPKPPLSRWDGERQRCSLQF